jgi:hypothetical protein
MWKKEVIAEDGYSEFNHRCVENLNSLIEQTDARIILTSTRRINKTVEEFEAIMHRRGFAGQIADKINQNTELSSATRSEEIREWLSRNGVPEKYVIIDDDSRIADMGEPYIHHWVRTTYHLGLDESALEQALKILKEG